MISLFGRSIKQTSRWSERWGAIHVKRDFHMLCLLETCIDECFFVMCAFFQRYRGSGLRDFN